MSILAPFEFVRVTERVFFYSKQLSWSILEATALNTDMYQLQGAKKSTSTFVFKIYWDTVRAADENTVVIWIHFTFAAVMKTLIICCRLSIHFRWTFKAKSRQNLFFAEYRTIFLKMLSSQKNEFYYHTISLITLQ